MPTHYSSISRVDEIRKNLHALYGDDTDSLETKREIKPIDQELQHNVVWGLAFITLFFALISLGSMCALIVLLRESQIVDGVMISRANGTIVQVFKCDLFVYFILCNRICLLEGCIDGYHDTRWCDGRTPNL